MSGIIYTGDKVNLSSGEIVRSLMRDEVSIKSHHIMNL